MTERFSRRHGYSEAEAEITVRRAILQANWNQSQRVRLLEVDYHSGRVVDVMGQFELWSGFALAVLTAEPRRGIVEKSARHERTWRALSRGHGE